MNDLSDDKYPASDLADDEYSVLPPASVPPSPPKPLPRLYKSEPPPEEPGVEPHPKKKKRRQEEVHSQEPISENGEGGRKLLEATPTLETYEGRKSARIVIGAAVLGVLALSIFVIVKMIGGSGKPSDGRDPLASGKDSGASAAPNANPAQREKEAQGMFDHAKNVAEAGNHEEALSLLERIQKSYSGTQAAAEAAAAVARRNAGQPMFLNGAIVNARRIIESGPAPRVEQSEDDAGVDTPPSQQPRIARADGGSTVRTNQQLNVKIRPSTFEGEPHRETGLSLPKADVEPNVLPKGFKPRLEYGVHKSGWPLEILSTRDGSVMVFVPGGAFAMGRDDGRNEERPAHAVTLSPFYIDQHEVTAGQFKRALSVGGVRIDADAALALDLDSAEPRNPVTNLTYAEASDYANWVGKRIPTEAQWEFAARTTDDRLHPWGNSPAAWKRPRLPRQLDQVMSFDNDLSPYNVFDLAGNAWEWTSDWFDASWYNRLKGRNTLDPTGPKSNRDHQRSVRGGSDIWASSWRVGVNEDKRIPYLGFRCVLLVSGGSPKGFPASNPNGAAMAPPAPGSSGSLPPAPGSGGRPAQPQRPNSGDASRPF